MKKIGITGQSGFVGKHLANTIQLFPREFELIPFEKSFFESDTEMDRFVSQCDVIVHLAAMNRHSDASVIYQTNTTLADKLAAALKRTDSKCHVLFSSSTQEERDNLYGRSKQQGRKLLAQWAVEHGGKFTGMIIPNVFGPFCNPFYNSVIATFCYQLTHGEEPKIEVDGELKLIYVGELVDGILEFIRGEHNEDAIVVQHTRVARVSEILVLLRQYSEAYLRKGAIPELSSLFERNLFNTYRSYLDLTQHFPVKYVQNTDTRGAFVEVIRLGTGGQVSYSTTVPGITRGNHFHTRKIERFAVIRGEASIQMRRIGTNEILEFRLSGDTPGFVDMPVWYTHNITNIGTEELFTIFWINECYDPADPDTYMEKV